VAVAAGFSFPSVSSNLKAKPSVGKTRGPAPKSLKVKDIVVGKGPVAKNGQQVSIQYVGKLYANGKEFDSSWSRGAQPFSFNLGAGQVIPGFDQGVKGMHVGGRRIVIIPPALGYGADGAPPTIPGGATLIFVIDLVKVSK
jgi:peptidylprolyl isomerase